VAAPNLRPLRIGELLDAAITIYRANAATLIRSVAAVVVPLQVLGALVLASATPDSLSSGSFFPSQPETTTLSNRDLAIFLAGTLLSAVLTWVAGILATAACFKAVSDAYLGGRPEWRSSVRFAVDRLWPLLWLTFLGTILNILAIVPLVFPAIYLSVAWSVGTPTLLAEDVRGRRALGRSRRLVKGRWWPTAGVLVISLLLVGIVSLVIGGLLGALVAATGSDSAVADALVNGAAGIAGGVIATPFQAAVVTLLYVDLRVRKEGLDVELLARATGSDPALLSGPTLIPPPPPQGPAPGGTEAPPPYWPPPRPPSS